ncbi:flagellar protein [Evansella halocellulosilytica]|uniref:flagellar protein n=1 Tax=Evansella halocellulosilytica TaxID=2011013 RepID=UPI000BB774CF|nr:flagellar protein [Evansella halocellulosilytica]
MANGLKDIYKVTKALYDHLQKPFPKDEGREEYIEVINSYLTERAQLMEHVQRPNQNSPEEQIVQELIKMNHTINEQLAAAKGTIQMDLNDLKKRKKTGKKYETPYAGPTVDGIFFDSKK